MTTTYKYKSRLITAIAFIIMLLAAITPDAWQSLLPNQYWVFIPTIMGIITYAAAQLSEEKRVEVAETMVIEKQNAIMGQPLNEEYTFPSEEEETWISKIYWTLSKKKRITQKILIIIFFPLPSLKKKNTRNSNRNRTKKRDHEIMTDKKCPECKNKQVRFDETHKETYCSKCGLVLQGAQRYSGGKKINYPFGHI